MFPQPYHAKGPCDGTFGQITSICWRTFVGGADHLGHILHERTDNIFVRTLNIRGGRHKWKELLKSWGVRVEKAKHCAVQSRGAFVATKEGVVFLDYLEHLADKDAGERWLPVEGADFDRLPKSIAELELKIAADGRLNEALRPIPDTVGARIGWNGWFVRDSIPRSEHRHLYPPEYDPAAGSYDQTVWASRPAGGARLPNKEMAEAMAGALSSAAPAKSASTRRKIEARNQAAAANQPDVVPLASQSPAAAPAPARTATPKLKRRLSNTPSPQLYSSSSSSGPSPAAAATPGAKGPILTVRVGGSPALAHVSLAGLELDPEAELMAAADAVRSAIDADSVPDAKIVQSTQEKVMTMRKMWKEISERASMAPAAPRPTRASRPNPKYQG